MLLGQTRIDTDLDFGTEEILPKRSTAISVLQYVLESNTRRERALREAERNGEISLLNIAGTDDSASQSSPRPSIMSKILRQ
jgi:hypothetical protein